MADHTPPRLKACPACFRMVPVQASRCPGCGDVWPRRKGGRPAPSPADQVAAAMLAQAIKEGHVKGEPPIVGKRNLSRKGAKVLAEIKKCAAAEMSVPQIAHKLQCSEANVRRYAKDYNVTITKAESGPSLDGKVAAQMAERLKLVRRMLRKTQDVAVIAEALGVHKATARNYMKRVRDLDGIELPGFDRRSKSGFASK